MVMIFANEKVREYLLEHGLVYTFRTHHKKTDDGIRPQVGRDWATDRRTGKKIADIQITLMEPMDHLNLRKVLKKYAKESGFHRGLGVRDAVTQWIMAIALLNPNESNPNEPFNGWIYRVEVIGAEG